MEFDKFVIRQSGLGIVTSVPVNPGYSVYAFPRNVELGDDEALAEGAPADLVAIVKELRRSVKDITGDNPTIGIAPAEMLAESYTYCPLAHTQIGRYVDLEPNDSRYQIATGLAPGNRPGRIGARSAARFAPKLWAFWRKHESLPKVKPIESSAEESARLAAEKRYCDAAARAAAAEREEIAHAERLDSAERGISRLLNLSRGDARELIEALSVLLAR